MRRDPPNAAGSAPAGQVAGVFVDLKRRVVLHHRRGEGDAIPTAIVREGGIHLDPPGLTVAFADLFGGAQSKVGMASSMRPSQSEIAVVAHVFATEANLLEGAAKAGPRNAARA